MKRYRMGYFAQHMTIEMQLAGIVAVLSLLLAVFLDNTLLRLGLVAIFAVTFAAMRNGLMRDVVLDDFGNLHVGHYDAYLQTPVVTPFYSRFLGQPHYYIPVKSVQHIERLPAQAQLECPDRTVASLARAWLLERRRGVLITLERPARPQLFAHDEPVDVKQIAISVVEPERLISDVLAAKSRR